MAAVAEGKHAVVVAMRVPVEGHYVTVEICPGVTLENLRHSVFEAAQKWRKKCAAPLRSTIPTGTGAKARHSCRLAAQEQGAGWYKDGPSADWRTPEEEIKEAMATMAELQRGVSALDSRLYGPNQESDALKRTIRRTHHTIGRRQVVKLGVPETQELIAVAFNRKADRVPMFLRLDELAVEYGPLRAERRRLHGEVQILERWIKAAEKALARAKRKAG